MASIKRPMPQLYWGITESLWRQVADASPGATFFHRPEWAQVLARTYGYGIHPAYLEYPGGRKALLPIWTRPIYKGVLLAAASGYEGGYGGFISTGPLSAEELADGYRLVGNRFPDLTVLSNPFSPLAHLPSGGSEFEWTPLPETRVLRLAPLETLRAGYNRERQRASHRWQTAGVQTRVIPQPDPALIEVIYPIFERATRQWEPRWRRPRQFFEQLFQLARPWLHVTLAELHGQVAGAELALVDGQVAFGLILTWDHGCDDARISTALTEASLQHCHQQGCRWWDFGSSGHREQLNRFKETFGAQAWPLFEVRREAWIIKALQTIRSPYHHLHTAHGSV